MYDSLEELWPRLPHEAVRCDFDDGSDWAIYAARWYDAEFESMLDFVHFCFAYSSVMQFVIPNQKRLSTGLQMYQDEAADWFVPNEDPEAHARLQLEQYGTQQLDATHWLISNIGSIRIPWLNDRDHGQSFVLPCDDYDELYSFGNKGYLTIFVINN